VRANVDGTRAYLSYWDAGFIMLDPTDPTNPRYLGRTEYGHDEVDLSVEVTPLATRSHHRCWNCLTRSRRCNH